MTSLNVVDTHPMLTPTDIWTENFLNIKNEKTNSTMGRQAESRTEAV